MPIHAYLGLKGKTMGVISKISKEGDEDDIRVYRIDHQLVHPIDPENGQPSGKRRHMPLRICKKIDKFSPLLYEALTKAEQLECDIKLYHWESGTETHYFSIKLKKSLISSIRVFEAVELDPDQEELDPMEEISFSYDTIAWKHEPTGREHEDGWKLVGRA
jgi:type VI secretion system secreted protein Hcp